MHNSIFNDPFVSISAGSVLVKTLIKTIFLSYMDKTCN